MTQRMSKRMELVFSNVLALIHILKNRGLKGLFVTLFLKNRGLKGLFVTLFRRLGMSDLRDDHYVLLFDSASSNIGTDTAKQRVELRRFELAEDVPKEIMDTLMQRFGSDYPEVSGGMFRSGARLYVANIDGELATLLWCKSGSNLSAWYVKINPWDVVLYAMYTFREHRGKHLITWLTDYCTQQEITDGGSAFADCEKSNIVSLKALSRSGFRIIKTCKHGEFEVW